MKKSKFLPLSILLVYSLQADATIDTSKLIKVTPQNNPNCVEYYDYKNTMYCSTEVLSDTTVDPNIKTYETQKIVFDDRPWQAAWGKKTEEITTVEYVPAGDNVEAWRELVTSQYLPNLPSSVTPRHYADIVIKNIQESGFNPKINFIEETPTQVIFEFRIESPANMKQDELQIIRKGKKGFYILHYVIKEADMGDDARAKWLKNLKASEINSN